MCITAILSIKLVLPLIDFLQIRYLKDPFLWQHLVKSEFFLIFGHLNCLAKFIYFYHLLELEHCNTTGGPRICLESASALEQPLRSSWKRRKVDPSLRLKSLHWIQSVPGFRLNLGK